MSGKCTLSQESMLERIARGDMTFGGRVKDLESLKRRKLVHKIGPRYWLTARGREYLEQPHQQEMQL